MTNTILNRKTLNYLAFGIIIGFLVLSYLEIKEYYFSSKPVKNTEKYQDVPTDLKDNTFSGILDYLKQVEDPKLYVNTLGCYDNDQMIEDIKGKIKL